MSGFRGMKVGVVGTRHVHASGLAHTARELGCEIVGAWEGDDEAAGQWRSTGLAELLELDAVLERSDAVIVAGTNRERVGHSLQALDAGCAVLSEKPVAIDEDDLERLAAHADPARYMVALPVRFARAMQRAREAIRSGAIGTPLAGRGTNHGQYPGGWFGRMADAGGGAIMDHTVHVGDGLSWLLGERIVEVYADAARRMYDDIDVDDCGVLTLTFESGLFASLDASWSRPRSFHAWGDVWIELVGTEGRIIVDPMAPHLGLYDDRAGRMRTLQYADDDMTATMVRSFLAFARDGGESPVPLDEGVHASDVVFAAYRSAASHRPEAVTSRIMATR